ncbi:MAG: hypothetical protein GX750_09660 [Clostridia bacterium]|nr:hypothetical protein [Clostridia bacterium]
MSTVKVEKYLKVNRKLEIRQEGDEGKYYKSMIHGLNDRLLLVTPPYRGRDNLSLHRGDNVEVILIAEKEKILFKAKVTDRVRKPFFGYVLEAAEEGTRIQLREFVRVKVLMDVEWCIMDNMPENDQELEGLEFQQAVMVDLSGGGAGIVCDEPIPENTLILLRFIMPLKNTERSMSLLSEVRRCYRLDEQRKYMVGLAFLDLTQRDQDQIIEYVFQKLREQRLMEDEVN